MAAYKAVDPSFAERVVASMEREQAHRHKMDMDSLALERLSAARVHGERTLGQWLGFSISLAVIIAGALVAMYRSASAGASIITLTVVSLAGVFVYGRWRASKAEHQHGVASANQTAEK
jgi:uncharacterized membrane protein